MPKITPFTNAYESKINLNYHTFGNFNQIGSCLRGLYHQTLIILLKSSRLGALDKQELLCNW